MTLMRFEEIKRHLSRFRVGIAGAGGLGSNCAVALARSGVGTLVIADFDKVEAKNLNRQYYFADQTGILKTIALQENISRIDSDIKVITHTKILDRTNIPVIFSGCDVIVEAFDRAEMKEMIVEAVQLQMPGIPLVVGSGMAGWGRNELLKSRQVDKTLYICGDESSESDDDFPPMAARVGVVASMQANIVIEILMNKMTDKLRFNYENKA
jgi:sulfur carrier protein ThiS adenylyltransferase